MAMGVKLKPADDPKTNVDPADMQLDMLFENLEAMHEAALAKVESCRSALHAAESKLRTLDILRRVQQGENIFVPPAGGKQRSTGESKPRAPRGAGNALAEKILSVLTTDGMTPAQILEATMTKGTDDEPRARALLFSLTKAEKIGRNGKLYTKV